MAIIQPGVDVPSRWRGMATPGNDPNHFTNPERVESSAGFEATHSGLMILFSVHPG
jgi:hypothetical protein